MTAIIKDHGVWQDTSKWIFWIYRIIENRRLNKSEKMKSKQDTGNNWVDSWNKFLGKKQTDREKEREENSNGNILFNSLTQFTSHFTNFGMSLEAG